MTEDRPSTTGTRGQPTADSRRAQQTPENYHPATTRSMTDTTPTTEQSRTDGQTGQFSQTMGEMDHAPPVDGHRRAFERNNEGRPVTDGGRPADGESGDKTDEADGGEGGAETETKADGGNFSQKMKEMDHTPPVDGANRTFERGGQSDDVSE